MTAAKTTKPAAKKMTMSLKTGKITVKPAAKKTVATKAVKPAAKKTATSTVDQILKNQGPIIVKAAQTKGAAAVKTKVKAEQAPKADKGPSKMDEAIKVWDSMPKAERKDVIKAFQERAKLTPAGANTYYALIKARKAKNA